jgi:hypothetical protein
MKNKQIIFTVLATALIVAVFAGIYTITGPAGGSKTNASQDELEALAVCLTDSGAKFYGAFWCPHCQDQKKDFGSAVEKVPYVECATPDGRGQTQVCTDAQIESYPTWVFPNGERVSGRLALTSLATATGCPAPSAS